jgi:thioredoxin 1
MAMELTRENFEAEVKESDTPLLVDFWGPQCRPCLALMPSVEALEKDYEGRVKLAKVNATQNRMLCAKLRVLGLPTFLLYRDGVEVKRLTGENVTIREIRDAVDTMLGSVHP